MIKVGIDGTKKIDTRKKYTLYGNRVTMKEFRRDGIWVCSK